MATEECHGIAWRNEPQEAGRHRVDTYRRSILRPWNFGQESLIGDERRLAMLVGLAQIGPFSVSRLAITFEKLPSGVIVARFGDNTDLQAYADAVNGTIRRIPFPYWMPAAALRGIVYSMRFGFAIEPATKASMAAILRHTPVTSDADNEAVNKLFRYAINPGLALIHLFAVAGPLEIHYGTMRVIFERLERQGLLYATLRKIPMNAAEASLIWIMQARRSGDIFQSWSDFQSRLVMEEDANSPASRSAVRHPHGPLQAA